MFFLYRNILLLVTDSKYNFVVKLLEEELSANPLTVSNFLSKLVNLKIEKSSGLMRY